MESLALFNICMMVVILGLYFNKEELQILNDCGLELNIDIYVLSVNVQKS
jgi:hypothetical protein